MLINPRGLQCETNLYFSEFWLPSGILAEMENFVFLENRYSDSRQILAPLGALYYSYRTSEKLRVLPILATILNFGRNVVYLENS